MHFYSTLGFPGDSVVKNLPTNPRDHGDLPDPEDPGDLSVSGRSLE